MRGDFIVDEIWVVKPDDMTNEEFKAYNREILLNYDEFEKSDIDILQIYEDFKKHNSEFCKSIW